MRTRLIVTFALALLTFGLAAAAAPAGPAPAQPPDRLQWFREAKFGLFIHWGVYSMIGREEWARQLLHIPLKDYQYYADNFNPVNFDPDAWAALARDAGVRYVIITSKHHDGFAMFDSAYTDYDIMHAKGADFGRYMDFATNQVKELVAKYDPAVLWFDGEWEHSNEEQRAFAVGKMLLEMKPSLLINDRLFKREPGYGDFGTPENYVPATGIRNADGTPRLWEACYTMNWNGWGYNRYETEFHSASQLIRQLVEIVSKGGNLLLNVGPQPDGRIQPDFEARLRRIGEWLKTNGEAIYGTTASPFERLPFFGRATVKGSTLYIHVMGWPQDARIVLPGLKNSVKKACLLVDRGKDLAVRRAGKDVVVTLPARAADPDATVVALELDGPPAVENRTIGPASDGRVELPVYLADLQSAMGQRAYLDYFYRTTMLANWQNVNDYPEWSFTTDKPGTYEVRASYASMWGGQAAYEVEVDGQKLAAKTQSSPSVYFPATFTVGQVTLPAGEHTLRVRITAIANNHAMNLEKIVLVPAR
jgi:alpha-L-fucosidase